MSLLLCHECYTWVEPHNGHCPECLGAADFNEADPPLSRLREVLGDLTEKLGEIHVRRRALPTRGLLYATTTGLYFLPHSIQYFENASSKQDGDHTVIWSLAASLWAPLYLFVLLFQSRSDDKSSTMVMHPQIITPKQSDAMPELLMDNPGAFFVPSSAIHSIHNRLGGWVIERNPGRKIKFKSSSQRGAFDRRISKLMDTPTWKHLVK